MKMIQIYENDTEVMKAESLWGVSGQGGTNGTEKMGQFTLEYGLLSQ